MIGGFQANLSSDPCFSVGIVGVGSVGWLRMGFWLNIERMKAYFPLLLAFSGIQRSPKRQ